MPKCVWKVYHKNWTLQWQKLYQKVIHSIVATNGFAYSGIVTHSNTAWFSIKTTLCETKNIIFSKNYWKLGKMMLDSERTFKIMVKSHWTVISLTLTSSVPRPKVVRGAGRGGGGGMKNHLFTDNGCNVSLVKRVTTSASFRTTHFCSFQKM